MSSHHKISTYSSKSKMETTNLMIVGVQKQFTAKFIAQLFWNQHIAMVRTVTLIPYLDDNSEIYNIAYITLIDYCDSEIAYNFIRKLKTKNLAKIVYQDDDTWNVTLNTHNNGQLVLDRFTTIFSKHSYDTIDANVTLRPHQQHFTGETPVRPLYSKKQPLF